jgi:amidase
MSSSSERPRVDHYLTRETTVYALDREAEPRLVVDPGAVVTVETHDARGGRLKRPDQVEETTPDFSERFPKANPATGPIYIRGAAPGVAVTIDVLSIDLDPTGFVLVKPDMGIIRGLSPKPIARICEVREGLVHFGELRFPVRPMVGVIGVAPAGEAIGTAYVGDHGGNIDTILAAAGSRMILRAQVEGALLYIGDVHAAMGDGEVSGTGIEIGARVTVRIGLGDLPAKRWPRLETPDRLVAIGSAPTFEAASAVVVEEMISDLGERHCLSPTDAFMLISAIGDLRVNQACGSKIDVSLRLEMPRLAVDHPGR